MSDDLQAEVERLREENRRLNAIQEVKKDERAAEMNMALRRQAAHADSEASRYRQIQAGGLEVGGSMAEDALVRDWGLKI